MMKFTILTVASVATFAFTNWDAPAAQASNYGVHFGGRGYQVDIGRTYHQPAYRTAYRTRGFGRPGCYDRGYYRWHDTSHYHYHPGEFVRHRNHYHYIPGHYDFHETGHYDYYDGSHHGW